VESNEYQNLDMVGVVSSILAAPTTHQSLASHPASNWPVGGQQ